MKLLLLSRFVSLSSHLPWLLLACLNVGSCYQFIRNKQRGKIKNKVLKLQATVLKLQAQAAQGAGDAAKLAEETKKLANNVALDKAQAGKASTKLSFAGSIGSGTATAAPAAAPVVAAPVEEDDDEEETACEAKIRKSRAARRAALEARSA